MIKIVSVRYIDFINSITFINPTVSKVEHIHSLSSVAALLGEEAGVQICLIVRPTYFICRSWASEITSVCESISNQVGYLAVNVSQ